MLIAVNKVKNIFKIHSDRQKHRKEIVSKMFDKETEVTFVREMSRKNEGHKIDETLLQGIQHSRFNDCKSAVIEKYLTYCKNQYID